MLKLTLISKESVYIQPKLVEAVIPTIYNGSVISFVSGQSIKVDERFDYVQHMISEYLKQNS